jgi:hypothetical protein
VSCLLPCPHLLQFELLTYGTCRGAVHNMTINGNKHSPVYQVNFNKLGKK